MSARPILYSLLFVLSLTCKADLTFVANFTARNDARRLAIPAEGAAEIYRATESAILIESVVCDGVPIQPELITLAGTPLDATDACSADFVFYQYGLGNSIESAVTLEGNGTQQRQVRSFKIPRKTTSIEINYRVRYPSRTTSKIMKITYLDDFEDPHILHTK